MADDDTDNKDDDDAADDADDKDAKDGDKDDADDADDESPEALKKARDVAAREAAQYRRRAQKAEDELKKQADAKLTDKERLEKENADLQVKLAERDRASQTQRVQSTVIAQAAKLGFGDPEDAYRLIDAEAIEVDDDGKPTNVEDLLKDLLEAKPYLSGQAPGKKTSNPGGGGRPADGGDMNAMFRGSLANKR